LSVTIYDIAEQAKVSIATVSRVFNDHPRVSDKTRARVRAVAEELGYQPHVSAQSLARRKTHLLSAVIPAVTNYFFVEVMRGLQDRLAQSEFDLLVFTANEPEVADEQLNRSLQRGLSAGVLLFSMPITDALVRRLKQSGQPVILVDCFHPDFDSVSINNELGGCLATQHLIALGHTHIGMVAASRGVPAAERRKGYERALHEAGLPVDKTLVEISTDLREHGYTEQAGYRAARALLSRRERPTAIFATSDIQALGVMRAVKEAGLRTPEDISIVGFDDILISEYVGLTTIRQPMRQMGELAVEKFLSRLEQREQPISHTVFTPQLIGRSTTNGSHEQISATRHQERTAP